MIKNMKAALLSALVLPGLGQIYKGEKAKGGAMIFLVNLFILWALALVMKGAGRIFLTARLGGVDTSKLLEDIQRDSPSAKWLLAAFFLLWAYGAADALLAQGKCRGKGD